MAQWRASTRKSGGKIIPAPPTNSPNVLMQDFPPNIGGFGGGSRTETSVVVTDSVPTPTAGRMCVTQAAHVRGPERARCSLTIAVTVRACIAIVVALAVWI